MVAVLAGRNRRSGFTLVEVAIALTIVGILTAPLFPLANAMRESQRIERTNAGLATVRRALAKYLLTNGHYPCPAPPLETGRPYEFEAHCQLRSPVDIAAAGAHGVYVTMGKRGVVIEGAVPFRRLNLGRDRALDGWDRQLTYAVAELATEPGVGPDTTGAIEVKDGKGVSMIEPPSAATWLVLSHGRDGSGAFAEDGGVATCPKDQADGANCRHAGSFMASRRSYASGDNHYDDMLDYLVWPELPVSETVAYCQTSPIDLPGEPRLVQDNAIIRLCNAGTARSASADCRFVVCRHGSLMPIAVNLVTPDGRPAD